MHCDGEFTTLRSSRAWNPRTIARRQKCECIDPSYKLNICPENPFIGDNVCNGNLNNEENCFDGGDCCGAWDCNILTGLVEWILN